MIKTKNSHAIQQGSVALGNSHILFPPMRKQQKVNPRRRGQSSERTRVQTGMRPMVAVPVFSSYIVRYRHKMTILVCEDAGTFARVRDLMHDEGQRRFFGQRFDGVLYLRRESIVEPGALQGIERALNNQGRSGSRKHVRRCVTFLVWGDVSRAGIARMLKLYQSAKGLQLRAFLPAYHCMLDRAYGRSLPRAENHEASSFSLRLAAHLGECQKQTLRRIVEDQLIIPQELVTTRILRKRARG